VGIVVFCITLSLIGIIFGNVLGHDVAVGNFNLRIIAIIIALTFSSLLYNRIVDDGPEKSVSPRTQNRAKSTKSKDISIRLKEMRENK
jgi:uncharacterized membrane protein